MKVLKVYETGMSRGASEDVKEVDSARFAKLIDEATVTLHAFSPVVEKESIEKAINVMDSMGWDRRVMFVVAEALGRERWDADHVVVIARQEQE